jgi:hypothetical protein
LLQLAVSGFSWFLAKTTNLNAFQYSRNNEYQ